MEVTVQSVFIMAVEETKYTSREFAEFVNLPENADQLFERINGEIITVSPSFPFGSSVAVRFICFIMDYLLEHDIAHVTEGQGGYDISDEDTFAPDVGVILKSRLPELPDDQFCPIPPDVASEVVSESDLKYKTAKIPLLWYTYTYPKTRTLDVYAYGEFIRTAGIDDTLDGGDVLPGFTLKVREIFPM